MIKKIKNIKGLGIFSSWFAENDIEFGRYNLFYGRNGSGKSTLSALFRIIEKKELLAPYANAEFDIELNTTPVTNINHIFLIESPIIKVFNKDFVLENTKLEQGTAESIIYLGRENTILKQEIDDLKIKIIATQEAMNKSISEHQNKLNQQENFFVNAGRELKAFFSHTIYSQVNYNRNNASDVWEKIIAKPSLNECLIKEYYFQIKKSFIAQNQKKKKIENKYEKIDESLYTNLYDEIRAILKINPVIKTIKRLKDNPDIANWVQTGIAVHKNHTSNNCEFCGKPLDESKLVELENHFNEEFKQLQKTIEDKYKQISNLFLKEKIIETSNYYDDYLPTINASKENINEYIKGINKGLQDYLELLKVKFNNPLQISFRSHNISPSYFNSFNDDVDTINGTIDHQNKRIEEYETEAEKARQEIEIHLVAKKAIDEDFKKLLGTIKFSLEEKEEATKAFQSIVNLIAEKEKELQNDAIAIEEINDGLHKFLGINEISLERNTAGGYQLKRHGEIALNLSEGEKTAIALIYFIAKIKERDNDIKNTIIVLDDPISSFDSNHLFNAAHLIREEFHSEDEHGLKVLQLFVLTHNFHFFSLIKEFFQNKINVYTIKNIYADGKRKAIIKNADNALKHFSSEYHFLFSEVKTYCETVDKTYFDSHVVANMSRQLLESFLSFKYGRKKLENCFNEIEGFSDLAKVRKFVNHYSHRTTHGNNILGFNDNVFAESETLVPLVLKLMEHVDALHYKSMLARVNGS